jgi:hypothetical protein
MYLIAVLLPLYDNEGVPLDRGLFQAVAAELTGQFHGLTAHTRAPAQGLWREENASPTTRDDIVIYEVVTASLDRRWWAAYRQSLEARFRQEQVLIRAQPIELL